jgi:D-alanyl-D-alanine-carboxypeptidase/D-alanyl-D-alanine-endopeptidase
MQMKIAQNFFNKSVRYCILLLFIVCPPCFVLGQQRNLIDWFIAPLVEGQGQRAIVVGVIDSTGRNVYGYGSTSLKAQIPLDGLTLFEIGSVTKVFTGLLLADMVEHGLVELEAPIYKYLPSAITVPQWNDQQITFLHLATHTSGLPRLPSNLKPLLNLYDPYARYTVENLNTFLSSYSLRRAPGTKYEYSNLGMGLLGHVLATYSGTSYEALIIDRLCMPLGLEDTRIMLNAEQQARFLQGYNMYGYHTSPWRITPLAGAGALHSSANDLLTLLERHLSSPQDQTAIGQAMRSSMAPYARAAHDSAFVGLGWHILASGGKRLYWHNGMTGGHSSFIGFSPKDSLGLVILANYATFEATRIGFRLLKALSGDQVLKKSQRLSLNPQLWFNRVEATHIALQTKIRFDPKLTILGNGGYDTGRKKWDYEVNFRFGFATPQSIGLDVIYHHGIDTRYQSMYYSQDIGALARSLRTRNRLDLSNAYLEWQKNTSIQTLFGGQDHFDYFGSERINVKINSTWRAANITAGVSFNHERHFTVAKTSDDKLFDSDTVQRLNPPIDEGTLRSLELRFGWNDKRIVSSEYIGRRILLTLEHSNPKLLSNDFDFTRLLVLLDGRIFTFKRQRYLANTLDLRVVAGAFAGKLPVQRFSVVEGSLGRYTPFGVLRTLRDRSYEGENFFAIFWEHNFRTIPFELLGWHNPRARL